MSILMRRTCLFLSVWINSCSKNNIRE